MAKAKTTTKKGATKTSKAPATATSKPATQTSSQPASQASAQTKPQPAAQPAGAGTARSARAAAREAAARKRRNQYLLLIAGGVAVAALAIALVVQNFRQNQPVVGEETFATQGNVHIPLGSVSPVAYNSTPPTSGPHYENLAAWGIHEQPVRYEHLVHNLEDGGVVVYYQCEDGCPELVAELETILEPYLDAGRHVALARNDPAWTVGGSQPLHQDMGARIALAAWQKLLTMDEVDADTIRQFIERYEGIDHHRG
jgi:hypothetical protein